MITLDVLTATLAAFPTVLSHPGRVLLALALLSPKWALVLVCAVIHTTYCVLTATLAAFPTVLSHPGRVLLALAILSPKWALVLVCAVICTTYCVIEETALGLFGYNHRLLSEQHSHSFFNGVN